METADQTAAKYFAEVGAYKLPTPAEEREFFKAYDRARTQAEIAPTAKARAQADRERILIGQRIACGYLRFVILQASKRTRDKQLLKDLISQGNIGLMVGIEKFDLKHNVRFLTYAANWINVHMQEYFHKQNTVHVPSHTRKEMRRKRAAQVKPGAPVEVLPEEPTLTPLSEANGLSVPSDDDTERSAGKNELNVFDVMEMAALTRVERLLLTYLFGLRGAELPEEELPQLFWELDGSIFSADQIEILKRGAVAKVKSLLAAKGINALSDVL